MKQCNHWKFTRKIEPKLAPLCGKTCEKPGCEVSTRSDYKLIICLKCEHVYCKDHYLTHTVEVQKKGEPVLVKYKMQIETLRTYGLTDLKRVIPALVKHKGNTERAIEEIFNSSGNNSNLNPSNPEPQNDGEDKDVVDHCIYLDLSNMQVKCIRCPENEPIHPFNNIHGFGYRYVTEYFNINKIRPSFVQSPTQFIHRIKENPVILIKLFGEDSLFKNEEVVSLFETLFELVVLGGHTGTEDVICDYIEDYIKKQDILKPENSEERETNIKVYRDSTFGICIIHEPPSFGQKEEEGEEENPIRPRTILIDSHIDIVPTEVVKEPIIFNDQETLTCLATGFDDRLSVAVALTLLKYFKPSKNLRLIYLFSKAEEKGFKGFEHFFLKSKLLFTEPRMKIDEVTCLDVHYGKMRTGEFKGMLKLAVGGYFDFMNFWYGNDVSKLGVIGDGIVPNFEDNEEFEGSDFLKKIVKEEESGDVWNGIPIKVQKSWIEENNNFRSTNLQVMNYQEFKEKHGTSIKKGIISALVVDMHEVISYASLVDIWNVYRYLKLRSLFWDSR